jgi:hypothetical protein
VFSGAQNPVQDLVYQKFLSINRHIRKGDDRQFRFFKVSYMSPTITSNNSNSKSLETFDRLRRKFLLMWDSSLYFFIKNITDVITDKVDRSVVSNLKV